MKRSELLWTSSPESALHLNSGSDVEDLSRYKNILAALQNDLHASHENDFSTAGKENLEQRLLMLEHEIDGLLKRKITFTSKDSAGTRFLDYTTLINEK